MFTPMGVPFSQEALRNLNMRNVANDHDFLRSMKDPLGAAKASDEPKGLGGRHFHLRYGFGHSLDDPAFLRKMHEGRQARTDFEEETRWIQRLQAALDTQGDGWTNRHFDPVAEEFRAPAKGEMKRAKARVIEPLALPDTHAFCEVCGVDTDHTSEQHRFKDAHLQFAMNEGES